MMPSPSPRYVPSVYKWTTQDELRFVRGLLERKQLKTLKAYLTIARVRDWRGTGMCVEPGQVILATEDAIRELESNGHGENGNGRGNKPNPLHPSV